MRFLLSVVLFLSSTSAFAFELDADQIIKDITWNTLTEKVINEGVKSESGLSQLRGLSMKTIIEKDKAHISSYLDISGKTNMFGEFFIDQVAITAEQWQIQPDGTWLVDQWFFYISPKGDLLYSAHRIVEKDGVSATIQDLSPGTKEEQLKRWQHELSMWL